MPFAGWSGKGETQMNGFEVTAFIDRWLWCQYQKRGIESLVVRNAVMTLDGGSIVAEAVFRGLRHNLSCAWPLWSRRICLAPSPFVV